MKVVIIADRVAIAGAGTLRSSTEGLRSGWLMELYHCMSLVRRGK